MFANKIFRLVLYLFALLLLLQTSSFAVPAIPFQIEMKQPDGNHFKGYIKGDEWFNWRETTDGRVIIQNQDTGFFEFARIQKDTEGEQLIPSGIVVTPALLEGNNQQGLPSIKREDLIRLRQGAMQKMFRQ